MWLLTRQSQIEGSSFLTPSACTAIERPIGLAEAQYIPGIQCNLTWKGHSNDINDAIIIEKFEALK
jgi:hypothetical protein